MTGPKQHDSAPPPMEEADLVDNVQAHHFGILENTGTGMDTLVGAPDPQYGRLKE